MTALEGVLTPEQLEQSGVGMLHFYSPELGEEFTAEEPKDEFKCPPLPHAFYVLLVGRGMPETLTTGEQHAWLYRHLVEFDDVARQLRLAREILDPLEKLREPEGASVTIYCPNPDFGGPAQAIDVCNGQTRWDQRRFEGDTLAEALEAALEAARREFEE